MNPNKDELHKIKNWLKNKELEDEISCKSQDRVLTDQARQIRRIKPLPKGACQFCLRIADRLVPVQIKVCKRCAEKFSRSGGNIKFQKKEFILSYCEHCLGKTFVLYMINPFVCIKCTSKIGRRHQFGKKEAIKDSTPPWRERWQNQKMKIRKE